MKIDVLLKNLPDHYTFADRELIQRAYRTAEEAHRAHKRPSGKPYIDHCAAVASILVDLRMPANVVAAGLLHDTVEDSKITLEDLEQQFGDDIAKLVNGVTKLTHLSRVSRRDQYIDMVQRKTQEIELQRELAARLGLPDTEIEETSRERSRQAAMAQETLRKIFLAIGEDIRVVLIKLADRLHNMRTLGYVPEARRRQVARQTLDIYAPLARRLGIWQIKSELEDLAFRHTNPDVYQDIAGNLDAPRSARESQIKQIVKVVSNLLQQNGIQAKMTGRPKHIYSIYKKMREKDLAFDAIHDLRGIRIVVDDIPTCYRVLGLIHNEWRPLPGEFHDFIAAPKENFYQSIHTVVNFEDGKTLEVQVCTQEMHDHATYGIASGR